MSKSQRMTGRHGVILQMVSREQHVTVAGLSQRLGVSEVSIRRNLKQLEHIGLLRRVRGGAEAISRPGQVSLFDARQLQNVEIKQRIGEAAAGLIGKGDAILLDSGTTVLEIARHIPGSLLEAGGLTIVTRSLVIASELRLRHRVRLIMLGGLYMYDFDDFVGAQVEHALATIHVRTLFMGTDGLSAERGLTTDNVLEAKLYRMMANVAERVVVVTDSSKIGLDKLEATLAVDEIHTLITDAGAPDDFVAMLREKGVEVILVPAV